MIMIARLNFLLAVSVSVVLAFYVVGRFVLYALIVRIAPEFAPYFVAAFALSALMLTVLILAKTVIRLERTSVAARKLSARPATFLAQAVIYLGHALAIYGVYVFFTMASDSTTWVVWVLAGTLYLAGIAIAIADWRKRALSVSA